MNKCDSYRIKESWIKENNDSSNEIQSTSKSQLIYVEHISWCIVQKPKHIYHYIKNEKHISMSIKIWCWQKDKNTWVSSNKITAYLTTIGTQSNNDMFVESL